MARKRRTNAERFWRYVRKTEGCWLWIGTVSVRGYGSFHLYEQGCVRHTAAHRVSYELAAGPIPSGMVVRHLCHVRHCVRPDHLALGTQADNMRDMAQRARRPAPHALRQPGDMPSWSEREPERFWQCVEKGETCWLWTGPLTVAGYGRFNLSGRGGRAVRATSHRYAYELAFGPIPATMLVAHRCDNRACVRPDHLFLATPAENSADMTTKGRQARGSRNGAAKLSEADVRQAAQLAAGGLSDKAIAQRFGVSRSTIGRAINGTKWAHLPLPRPSAAERTQQRQRAQVAAVMRGERCHKAKLTAADIPAIRRAYDSKAVSAAELGRRYGVSDVTICYVGLRRTWRHVPE